MMDSYKAVVARDRNGTVSPEIESVPFNFLPENEVLIKVHYAALNYKDALSGHGHTGITRAYPHTPGVDAAGVVVRDNNGIFMPGTEVICTSFDLGMNTNGGFAEYISVPAKWLIPLPAGMSMPLSMVYGTAAYTAALALHKMELCGQSPDMGPIMITGASGGVGSMAVALLSHAGYTVHAASGKADQHEYLKTLGAAEIVSREDVDDQSGRPLLRPKWAGAIDNVGGNVLSTLLKACDRNGSVATIGLVKSPDLATTVYPFILNGINLLGVDSAETPIALRHEIWRKLAAKWRFFLPDNASQFVSLEEIPALMGRMLKGETTGRIVADMTK
ncbi:MAG: YhdH/YhfP family quinone oxidoreductase [Flavobacteriales bacterium]|jgi:acrylyl-CoA reductase (NADPH)|nr:YhdH/YhfP family quinone oxidoreductase [Flavobacteriales bacterium]